MLGDPKMLLLKKKWFHPFKFCFMLLFPFYNKNIDVSAFVFCRNEALDEICFKVCICNTVRDILEGRAVSVQFNQLFLRPNKEKIEFLLEVRHSPMVIDHCSMFSRGAQCSLLCLLPLFPVVYS